MDEKEILKGLKPFMSSKEVEEWLNKVTETGIFEEIAKIIYHAYEHGVYEYSGKYFNADEALHKANEKYATLAIKVCEKLI